MKKKDSPSSKQSEYTLVYSTTDGSICSGCSRPVDRCGCHKKSALTAGDGVVRISRSTKGRKGKGVTVITGLPLKGDALKNLVQRLKQRCGAGGTIKDRAVEIQGEHREFLAVELKEMGYKVICSGG